MASYSSLSGIASLLSGLTALSVAAGFGYINDGFFINLPVEEMFERGELLIGFLGLALVFQVGTPFFCAAAFFFGIPARRLWTARIGIAAGGLSLLAYLFFVRACSELLSPL